MKKPYLFGLLAVAGAAGLFSLYSVVNVEAQEDGARETLIDRIIAKFNLNESEVDAVVDEFRGERQAERQAEVEARLTQAVTDGKITEEQKAKVLAKIQEWQGSRGDWQNMTQEQRREKMEEHRADMEAFEEEIGVEMRDIIGKGLGKGGMGEGGMGRGGMGRGQN